MSFHLIIRSATLFCTGLSLFLQPGRAVAGRQAEEGLLKAAYIYNFSKYVTWPTVSGTETIDICLLGRDPLAGPLHKLEEKKIQSREITVDILDVLPAKTDCEVLFISRSEQEKLAAILTGLVDRAVLTVSDIKGFARRGGMIELVKKENKIRFIINRDSVARAGLVISSRLLNLATVLSGDPEI